MVRSTHFEKVRQSLEIKKKELNLLGEVKWQKVTPNYLTKYESLIDLFFKFIKEDKLKVRIMFTHNVFLAKQLTKEQRENEYFLLYYQFIKHAFGFRYSNNTNNKISLYPFFDQLPDTREKNRKFKDFIYNLQFLDFFREANLIIHGMDDIAEARSHDHVILQCLDVVLGAIEFRLNEKHKEIPEGKKRRGKRTIAKEKLYKHINKKIREIYPNFNIGESTGIKNNPENRWLHPYRHWKFVPSDKQQNKNYQTKKQAPLFLRK